MQKSDGQTQQQFGRAVCVTLRKSLNLLGLSVLILNTRGEDAHLPGMLWRAVRQTSVKAPSTVPAHHRPLQTLVLS